ncbi:glycosyltransferase [Angustibacter aerolatus]
MTEPAGEPLAAVVVPIYGVVDHLGECLTSLARQTVAERLQVVLVDDGSVDGSAQVAASFADGRPGWSLVRQPNAGPGPGAARNRGLRDVRAPYVLFCDGDDVLEPGAMEALVAAATRTGADVVVAAARQIPRPRTWRWTHLFEPLDGTVLTGDITDFPDLVHHPAPGDKLFRVQLLHERGLRFGEGIHHQDTLVTVPALLGPSRLAVLREVAQGYRRRGDGTSIMDNHFLREQNTWDHLQVVERLATLRPTLPPERVALLDAFLVRSFQGFLARAWALPAEAAQQLLTRARAVYASVDPELVVDLTDGPVHALPYRAVLADDLAGLRDPAGSATGLDLSEPDAVRLRVQVDPPWDRALSLGRLRATADAVVVDGADLVLRGTVRLAGAPALHLLGAPVSVRLRGAGRTVPAVLSPAAGAEALQTCRFEARVPLAELPLGTAALRVVVTDGEHQRSGRMALAEGAERRATGPDGRVVRSGADAEGAAQVSIEPPPPPPPGRSARLRDLGRSLRRRA